MVFCRSMTLPSHVATTMGRPRATSWTNWSCCVNTVALPPLELLERKYLLTLVWLPFCCSRALVFFSPCACVCVCVWWKRKTRSSKYCFKSVFVWIFNTLRKTPVITTLAKGYNLRDHDNNNFKKSDIGRWLLVWNFLNVSTSQVFLWIFNMLVLNICCLHNFSNG